MYEVALVEAVQLSDARALPAVAASPVGAEGTLLEPEELELLLDELDEDELEEELLDDEEEEELEEEDEPVPLPPPPPDELEDEELEDDDLDELLFGVAEASLESTLVPVLFTAATL